MMHMCIANNMPNTGSTCIWYLYLCKVILGEICTVHDEENKKWLLFHARYYIYAVWSLFFGPCSCNTASFMLDELYASLHCKKATGLHHINVHKNWMESFPSVTAPSVFAVATFHESLLSIFYSRSWGFTAIEAEWHPWLNLNNITSFPFPPFVHQL